MAAGGELQIERGNADEGNVNPDERMVRHGTESDVRGIRPGASLQSQAVGGGCRARSGQTRGLPAPARSRRRSARRRCWESQFWNRRFDRGCGGSRFRSEGAVFNYRLRLRRSGAGKAQQSDQESAVHWVEGHWDILSGHDRGGDSEVGSL